MKLKFETVYRGFLGLCLLMLLWSFYASAQTNTNSPAATNGLFVTNAIIYTNVDGSTVTNYVKEPVEKNKDEWAEITKDFQVTFGLDQYPILQKETLGNPRWKYIASLIYIFLAFYISKFLDFLVGVWLKQWAKRTKTQFDDLLLELLQGPVKVVSFVIFLHIGLSVFEWPDYMEKIMSKGLLIVVAISLTYMVMKFVDLLLGYWKQKNQNESDRTFDDQLYPIIRKSLKVFIVVVAVLVTSSNLGVNITAAIASLSIGGLAIGLAAQDTLANLFGAVAVFLDKPFRIGDRIQLDAVDGTVETIGLRSTRVRNLDGFLVTVPNKTMGNATITNVTRRTNIKTVMSIGLTYDTPYERVKKAAEILKEVYTGHQKTQDVWVSFNKFGASSLDITVIHWWNDTDYKAYLAGMQEMNLEIKRRFDDQSLNFAFPTQTLYLKQDSGWKLTGEMPEEKPMEVDKKPNPIG
ncbi:MAG TPA: mechanosensitive ion channel family protein [Verrucomicrobiae bacterium]